MTTERLTKEREAEIREVARRGYYADVHHLRDLLTEIDATRAKNESLVAAIRELQEQRTATSVRISRFIHPTQHANDIASAHAEARRAAIEECAAKVRDRATREMTVAERLYESNDDPSYRRGFQHEHAAITLRHVADSLLDAAGGGGQ